MTDLVKEIDERIKAVKEQQEAYDKAVNIGKTYVGFAVSFHYAVLEVLEEIRQLAIAHIEEEENTRIAEQNRLLDAVRTEYRFYTSQGKNPEKNIQAVELDKLIAIIEKRKGDAEKQ